MDLIAVARSELERAMAGAGWTRCRWADSDVYERPVPKPFALRAQFWIDGAPVELQSTLWIACEEADQALADLGEEDAVAGVSRDPLDAEVTIERPDRVPTTVSEVVTRVGRTAEQM